ncbi:hypothetical protein SEVIR_1G093950v4 [Setaria viridis]
MPRTAIIAQSTEASTMTTSWSLGTSDPGALVPHISLLAARYPSLSRSAGAAMTRMSIGWAWQWRRRGPARNGRGRGTRSARETSGDPEEEREPVADDQASRRGCRRRSRPGKGAMGWIAINNRDPIQGICVNKWIAINSRDPI